MSVKSISLAYCAGSSDKVYHAQIEEVVGGFVVNFQYGRRGNTLQGGTKTTSPVVLAAAEEVFDKLVAEKTGKGYTTSEDGTPFTGTDHAGEQSDLLPMLPNPIDEAALNYYLNSADWLMQEKRDGRHQFMVKSCTDGTVGLRAINRKGKYVAHSAAVGDALLGLNTTGSGEFTLDGESEGDVYVPFDILSLDGRNLRTMPIEERYFLLRNLLEDNDHGPALKHIRTVFFPDTKRELFEQLKAERAEGVVFKKRGSDYVPGRPNSGGPIVKYKFKGSATCGVTKLTKGKRSVEIAVLAHADEGTLDLPVFTPVGKVTIPPNHELPKVGTLVEVEYLYAYPNGGSLFQTVYKGVREDKDMPDTYSTLKFKQGLEEDEA